MKKLFKGLLIVSLIASLAACSKQSTSETTTKSDGSYQTAITDLEAGNTKQAYQDLTQADKLSVKEQKFKQNLKYLLTAKKNLAANRVSQAEKNLQKLDNVTSPEALTKQITKVQKEYQIVSLANEYYNDVIAYYKADKASEAAGSLQSLNSLPNSYQAVANLQQKAAQYNYLIDQAQATSTSSASQSSASGYINARSSQILSSQYKKATGSDISSASSASISSFTKNLTNDEILQAFRDATGIPQEAGDQYYVQDLGDGEYQIEIRHTSNVNTTVSNLKGMYKFNTSTKKAQKQDAISGQYEDIN